MSNSITAANSIFMLAILNLYPVPQQLQGYAADAAFDTEAADSAEIVMGVDGIMSAGFVPFVTRQTINIMPDSPSSLIFEDWMSAQKAAREIYYANASVTLPSVNRGYVLTNGVLTSFPAIPGTRKVLTARAFVITWESINPVPV
jgi:hypothetical protein